MAQLLSGKMKLTNPQGASLYIHLFDAISEGVIPVAPISGTIPSAAGLVEGLKRCPADIAVLVPSIASELAESPELLEYCAKNLKMIWYCGGDLPEAMGNVIASKIRVANLYGASEVGITAALWSPEHFDLSDWKYVHYHPSIGYEMRDSGNGNGTHELVLVRSEKHVQSQIAFTIFPGEQEYATRDLFLPHPSKPDLWKWIARRDDIVVFLNGEKTNPISMEQHVVQASPKVRNVLVAGAQRFQAALIIEPADNADLPAAQKAELIEELWPTIEEANEECPAHARISKSHILLTSPAKPMTRTGKGTIQRFATYTLYSEELDTLYRDAEAITLTDGESTGKADLAKLKETGELIPFIRESLLTTTTWKDLDDDTNFFTLGMDSLQAITLTRKLRQTFAIPSISPSTIYSNPSLTLLSKALLHLSTTSNDHDKAARHQQAELRTNLLEKYKSEIALIPPRSSSPAPKPDKHTVLLTGSTGTLGSYILHTLLSLPSVKHVYCLNRRPDAQSQQVERNALQGLPLSLHPDKVTFLKADLAQHNLGLDPKTYAVLLESVTSIIHNAWPVNFNLPLSEFEGSIAGVVHLTEFTARARGDVHLLFVSSISSVLNYAGPTIPEEIIEDEKGVAESGYAQSKYVLLVPKAFNTILYPSPLFTSSTRQLPSWKPSQSF